ncbi:glycosyltransferase family 4 protein [Erythrobacter sp. R86502]|uniref:glycosyltransferase family 4 protein n=1 Tax=Erythrobacter sp. R86502 TaxID=3093846 RepID=UPI0036D2CCC9
MNAIGSVPRALEHAGPARPGRISFLLPGLRAGGSEHVVTFTANRLIERGHAVEIISFESGSAAPYYTPDPRIALHYLALPVAQRAKLAALGEIAQRTGRLRKHLKNSRPDLLISFLTRTNVQAILASRGLDIPVIVSERNNPVQQDPGAAWRWLRARLYPKAFGLITMTHGAMACFPPQMRRRSWVIPNMSEFGENRAICHDGDIRHLVAVGRLTHQKGFDLLLESFAAIAPHHPNWRLTIWGDGPDRTKLETLRNQLGLADRVLMPGVTNKPGGWITNADAFVLSSRFEGWGLVLGEAMAAGLPSVSFACDFGPAEMIRNEEDGLLVRAGDVPALAAALDRLMGDAALRKRLGARAQETSRQFRPDRIGQLWIDLVENVLAEIAPTDGLIGTS